MSPSPQLPSELVSIPRSGIRAVMDRAWALGEPIAHLEVGEPGFSTPSHIIAAFCDAARSGATRYTPNAGIQALREACAQKLRQYNGIKVDADQVLITVGAIQGLLSAVIGLVDHGDEVLTPRPGWPNYQHLITMAGAHGVSYDLEPGMGYQPDLDQISALITERTKMIILNSPSNPLGTVLAPETIDGILEIAERSGIWILSDECYDQIVFEGAPVSAAARELGSEQTITVHSFSKTYAMTGFRLGYLSAPRRVISLLTKLQESTVACVNAPAQYAGLEALDGPQDCVVRMVKEYKDRRDLALGMSRHIGLEPHVPDGAFYLWLEPPGISESMAFADDLLTQYRVAVAPGSTFGEIGRPAIRLSLAADRDAITAGIDAIGHLLSVRDTP